MPSRDPCSQSSESTVLDAALFPGPFRPSKESRYWTRNIPGRWPSGLLLKESWRPFNQCPGAGTPKTTGFALGSQVDLTREPGTAARSLKSYAALTLLHKV